MHHRKAGKRFGRDSSHRKAMMRNLAISLLEHNTIKTTVTKAKELRRFIEPLIAKSKDNSLATRRYLIDRLRNKQAIETLLNDVGPFFKDRPGGYTRVLKCGFRSDAAPMAFIQLVDYEPSK